MAKIFYVSIGMASTIHGSLELGRRLASRGHELTYLSHADIGADVTAAGFEFVRLTATAELSRRAAERRAPISAPLSLGRWRTWWRERRALRQKSLQGEELAEVLSGADCVLLDVECHYAILCTADLGLPRVLINFFFDVRFSGSVPPLSSGLARSTSARQALGVRLAVLRARLLNRVWLWQQRLSRPGLARPCKPIEDWTYYQSDLRALARTHGVSWHQEVDTGQWLRPAVYPRLPQLCLNLRELDFPHPDPGGVVYVGPLVRTERPEPRVSDSDRAGWEAVRDRRLDPAGSTRLVYCSFGTFYGANETLLRRIVEVFRARQDWELVVGLGARALPEALADLPANVTTLGWAPQAEVLATADCAIEHGGISGANECVHQRVPLLFYDGGQIDQPGVVARFVYHGVAVRGDAAQDDAQMIEQHIETLCESDSIRQRLESFAHLMAEQVRKDTACIEIERALQQAPGRMAVAG